MLHVTMMVPRPSEPFKMATQHRLAFSAISVGVFLGRANVLPANISTLPIFLCRKIKDGGYNNTNTVNKVWPTQNTPALQAKRRSDIASAKFVANWTESATSLYLIRCPELWDFMAQTKT